MVVGVDLFKEWDDIVKSKAVFRLIEFKSPSWSEGPAMWPLCQNCNLMWGLTPQLRTNDKGRFTWHRSFFLQPINRVQTLWFKTLHYQDVASGKLRVTKRVKVVVVATLKLFNVSVSKNECLKRVQQSLWASMLFRRGCRWEEQV